MQSVKGAGPASTDALISTLLELGHLKVKQVFALVGVGPMNRNLGMLGGKCMAFGGRARGRSSVHMAVIVAIQHYAGELAICGW